MMKNHREISMKKSIILSIFSWIVIGLIFFTLTILPMIVGIPSKDGILGQNTFVRAFCSFFLCNPYLKAAIFFGKGFDSIKKNFKPFSEYQKNNMTWAYYVNLTIPIIASLIVLFLVLKNSTEYLTGFHYLAILLYGISVTCLEIGIDKSIPQD
jgi:hypothetical protein